MTDYNSTNAVNCLLLVDPVLCQRLVDSGVWDDE